MVNGPLEDPIHDVWYLDVGTDCVVVVYSNFWLLCIEMTGSRHIFVVRF